MKKARRAPHSGSILKIIMAAAALVCAAAIAVFVHKLSAAHALPQQSAASETEAHYYAEQGLAASPAASIAPAAEAEAAPAEGSAAQVAPERDIYEFSILAEERQGMLMLRGMLRLTYVNRSTDTLFDIALRLYANDIEPGCMAISSVAANDTAAAYTLNASGSLLNIALPREIAPGEYAQIFLRFDITLPQTGSRFGVNSAGYMLGNALPIAAMYENGAWRVDAYIDEGDSFFSRAADYKLALSAPASLTLAHTGSRINSEADGNYITYYISAQSVREFALALIPGGVEQTASACGGRVTVRAIGSSKSRAAFAAQCAAAAVDFFSQKIGDYPYNDLYIVPFDQQGGMEYPGLIMLYKGNWAQADMLGALIIGHETAHQWFYGVVGSDQLNSPWLDESLAEYLGFEFLREYAGTAAADELAAERYANYRGQYTRTHRLDDTLAALRGEAYFYTVYAYGYDFYSALADKIGSGAFYEGLKSYFNANYMGIGTKQKLIEAFSQAADIDLAGWFEANLAAPGDEG